MPIHPNARRCIHIKLNHKQCGAPALTGEPYCRFHSEVNLKRRQSAVPVPLLQTAADIQLAITDTIRALIEGRIDRLRAGTILFGLQLAQNGLRIGSFSNVKFIGDLEDVNPAERSVIIPALDDRQAVEEFENEQEAAELADAEAGAPPARGSQVGDESEQFADYEAAAGAQNNVSAPSLSPSFGDRVGTSAAAAAEAAESESSANAPKRTVTSSTDSTPHHWTDDIPRDQHGYLKPTKQQQQRMDRIVMGLERTTPAKPDPHKPEFAKPDPARPDSQAFGHDNPASDHLLREFGETRRQREDQPVPTHAETSKTG